MYIYLGEIIVDYHEWKILTALRRRGVIKFFPPKSLLKHAEHITDSWLIGGIIYHHNVFSQTNGSCRLEIEIKKPWGCDCSFLVSPDINQNMKVTLSFRINRPCPLPSLFKVTRCNIVRNANIRCPTWDENLVVHVTLWYLNLPRYLKFSTWNYWNEASFCVSLYCWHEK